jgi:hypothetical protein
MRGWFIALCCLLPACTFMTENDEYYVGGSNGNTPAGIACDPLPAATGPVISVTPAQANELPDLVASAASGSTLSLQAGNYVISSELVFSAPGVTLRSAANDPSTVTLDGQKSTNLIRVTASDVTIAHVTLTRGNEIAVLVQPGPGLTGFRLHGARILDGGLEFLRVEGGAPGYADQGSVTCTDFQLTGELRPEVCCSTCVLLGLNVVGGRDWVLRDSRFLDLNCSGVTPGPVPPFSAIFRSGARDALIENNVFSNPQRGLGLGFLPALGPARTYPDAPHAGLELEFIDGIARNNVIFSNQGGFDTGIEINQAREPQVLHNTVIYTSGYRSIDWRWIDTRVLVSNNLVVDMGARDSASATTVTNLESTPLGYFVDPSGLDFHLTAGAVAAIDAATPHPSSGVDIDGQPHGPAPDIGADER